MLFTVSCDNSAQSTVLGATGDAIYSLKTIKLKMFSKEYKIVMSDKNGTELFTMQQRSEAEKPTYAIYSGEECLLLCSCVKQFIDRSISCTFLGEPKYEIKQLVSDYETVFGIFGTENDKIGAIKMVKNADKRNYEINIDDMNYREFMIMFVSCLEEMFYK